MNKLVVSLLFFTTSLVAMEHLDNKWLCVQYLRSLLPDKVLHFIDYHPDAQCSQELRWAIDNYAGLLEAQKLEKQNIIHLAHQRRHTFIQLIEGRCYEYIKKEVR
ncbi:hypothetical protein BH09DEP1_BH09DEP1_8270 [soil metagenome]